MMAKYVHLAAGGDINVLVGRKEREERYSSMRLRDDQEISIAIAIIPLSRLPLPLFPLPPPPLPPKENPLNDIRLKL